MVIVSGWWVREKVQGNNVNIQKLEIGICHFTICVCMQKKKKEIQIK